MASVREQTVASAGTDHIGGFAKAPGSDPRTSAEPRRRLSLVRAIEEEVIPRLVLAHRAGSLGQPVDRPERPLAEPSPAEVVDLATLVLRADAARASEQVAEHRARGVGMDAIYLDLLAPAARYLGSLWEEDLCDFTQVTIGLWRLRQVMRECGEAPHGRDAAPGGHPLRHALLVPAPGEQHTFGLAMVTEFFRRAGWTAWSGAPDSRDELLALVRGQWFAMVGFSVACGVQLETLAASIRAVRRASRNRAIGVMVGGPLFIEHPEIATLVGADATATDGRQAVLQAQAMVTLLAQRR